jgi:hypothetical protein
MYHQAQGDITAAADVVVVAIGVKTERIAADNDVVDGLKE